MGAGRWWAGWVVGGMGGDVALFAWAETWRSRGASEVVARVCVVLRKVRWLQLRRSLKTRRSADFDFAETAGGLQVRRLTAGF